jgi:hypothetical protein
MFKKWWKITQEIDAMAKIELYFGHPQDDKNLDGIEDHAYNQNINIETAVIRGFQSLHKVLTTRNEDNDTFFELILICGFSIWCKFPKVTTGVYRDRGFVYPKLVIHGDTGINKESSEIFFLSDEYINFIGKEVDKEFDYEYFGFKRLGKASLVTDDVIYHLRNKPHIYHEGNFIEVKEPKSA